MEDGCEPLRSVQLDEVAGLRNQMQLRAGDEIGESVRPVHRDPAVLHTPGDQNRHVEVE